MTTLPSASTAEPQPQPGGARRVQAVEVATGASRQLLLLSTGVLALTVTFSGDLAGRRPPHGGLGTVLVTGWVLFVISILCGLWFQHALVDILDRSGPEDEPPPVHDSGAALPSQLQMSSFLLAMACTAVAGVLALG